MSAPESSTGSSEAWEDVYSKYRPLLKQLTYNNKSIDVLTTMAKENMCFIKDIVSLIEAQITKKLGKENENFASEITENFERMVGENTKKCLFQLRSTWNGIFPLKKLPALDIRVNVLDPAWPIKPLPANLDFSSILAKRRFPKKSEHESTTESEIKAMTTESSENQSVKQESLSPCPKWSPCTQERSSRKRRCGSLSPSSSPPKTRKVSFVSAQPGPHVQAQQHFPHLRSFVQNPTGAVGNPPCGS